MPDTTSIYVKDVSKIYRIWDSPAARARALGWQALRGMAPFSKKLQNFFTRCEARHYTDFPALKNISLEVRRGESVGIIGRNGSGKSTLLQLIVGTLQPTAGTINTRGRIAALLELGSGFNPEFTGRENVYLNASILGLSRKEIDTRFEEIAAFANIGDFINQPVKTYSSGMMMRLAFAVIAHIDADILVIDEALAVGDVFFQQKCMRFLEIFKQNGGTILFVSHDIGTVGAFCNRAMLLSRKGEILSSHIGNSEDICKQYIEDIYETRTVFQKERAPLSAREKKRVIYEKKVNEQNKVFFYPFQESADSFGKGGGRLTDAYFQDSENNKLKFTETGQMVSLVLEAETFNEMEYPAFGFMIKDKIGQYVIAEGTDRFFRAEHLQFQPGEKITVKFTFRLPPLVQGEYAVNVAFAEGPGDAHVQHHWVHDALIFKVVGQRLVHGITGVNELSITITTTEK